MAFFSHSCQVIKGCILYSVENVKGELYSSLHFCSYCKGKGDRSGMIVDVITDRLSVCLHAPEAHSLTTKQSRALDTVSNRRDSCATRDYFISNSKNEKK